MIRLITYLVISVFTIVSSFAQVKSEEILIKNDSIQLPGTLTYNPSQKQPLIIFVAGSGNPNRDGNQPIYNVNPSYIKQLSDSITKQGIAFFRYDKRNVTLSNIKHFIKDYTFPDLAKDVTSIINHFKNDERFNQIILIGHSQGSLVAMLAIDKNISKYISIAGPGEPMDKTLVRQIKAQNEATGKIAENHIKELKSTGNIKTINPFLVSIFAKQNHQFLISYFKFDPLIEVTKIEIPALIINGDKDIQVQVSDAKALKKANTKAELAIIKNMNHVLKDIQKDEDNLKSYSSADFPISEQLIKIIVEFVKK